MHGRMHACKDTFFVKRTLHRCKLVLHRHNHPGVYACDERTVHCGLVWSSRLFQYLHVHRSIQTLVPRRCAYLPLGMDVHRCTQTPIRMFTLMRAYMSDCTIAASQGAGCFDSGTCRNVGMDMCEVALRLDCAVSPVGPMDRRHGPCSVIPVGYRIPVRILRSIFLARLPLSGELRDYGVEPLHGQALMRLPRRPRIG